MLDHEVGSEYTFNVLATDGAGATGITRFRLYVVDLNDNHPTFQHGLYHNHSISEDTQVLTEGVGLVDLTEGAGLVDPTVFASLKKQFINYNCECCN